MNSLITAFGLPQGSASEVSWVRGPQFAELYEQKQWQAFLERREGAERRLSESGIAFADFAMATYAQEPTPGMQTKPSWELRKTYTFSDDHAVEEFLAQHPRLVTLLDEAIKPLRMSTVEQHLRETREFEILLSQVARNAPPPPLP